MDSKEKKSLSVFIVEDDAFQIFILEKLIRNLGYDVIGKSSSGEEAVQLALRLKPDIIFMDISLEGEMDGIDASIAIQEKISTKIIYITGNSDDYHRKRAEKTDYSDYLIKPVTKAIIELSLKKIDS
tara:strand:- start:27015 stop:27395 length:381 start_codon:yes stop_codon:yes gene_type:complete